jgi:hypothetical protein
MYMGSSRNKLTFTFTDNHNISWFHDTTSKILGFTSSIQSGTSITSTTVLKSTVNDSLKLKIGNITPIRSFNLENNEVGKLNGSSTMLCMPFNGSPFDLLVHRNYSDENGINFKENTISKFQFNFVNEDDIDFTMLSESVFSFKIETYTISDKTNDSINTNLAELVNIYIYICD